MDGGGRCQHVRHARHQLHHEHPRRRQQHTGVGNHYLRVVDEHSASVLGVALAIADGHDDGDGYCCGLCDTVSRRIAVDDVDGQRRADNDPHGNATGDDVGLGHGHANGCAGVGDGQRPRRSDRDNCGQLLACASQRLQRQLHNHGRRRRQCGRLHRRARRVIFRCCAAPAGRADHGVVGWRRPGRGLRRWRGRHCVVAHRRRHRRGGRRRRLQLQARRRGGAAGRRRQQRRRLQRHVARRQGRHADGAGHRRRNHRGARRQLCLCDKWR